MTIRIDKKYLIFPANANCVTKRVSMKLDSQEVYGLDVCLDNRAPDFFACVDVSRFIGQELELTVEPSMSLAVQQTDELPYDGLYREPWRPFVHFTPKNGWHNDPNGLCYLDGVYHMFYQYNPCGAGWGNMHWGHAVSRDLVHWEEKDAALFPDQYGACFSGSAVVDHRNLLGLNADGQETMAIFYTATGNGFEQRLVVSDDGCRTFRQYRDAPVVPCIVQGNRDPKVVFCEELGCYIMALYLNEEYYALLSSKNLVDWKKIQKIRLPCDNECPDIYCLPDGNGGKKWVFSGAHGRYYIGEFSDGKFIPDSEAAQYLFGTCDYASQTFSGLPGGEIVRMSWNRVGIPSSRVTQQMSLPVRMFLKKKESFYRLCSEFWSGLDSLSAETRTFENVIPGDTRLLFALEPGAVRLRLWAELNPGQNFTLTVFGRTVTVHGDKNELEIGGSRGPLNVEHGPITLDLIIDRYSVQLLSDDGCASYTEPFFCDYNLPYLTVSGERTAAITRLEVSRLTGIWEE